jgi:hypothetical protein
MVLNSTPLSDAQPSIGTVTFCGNPVQLSIMLQINHSTAFVPEGCKSSTLYNAITLGVCTLVLHLFVISPMNCRLVHISK